MMRRSRSDVPMNWRTVDNLPPTRCNEHDLLWNGTGWRFCAGRSSTAMSSCTWIRGNATSPRMSASDSWTPILPSPGTPGEGRKSTTPWMTGATRRGLRDDQLLLALGFLADFVAAFLALVALADDDPAVDFAIARVGNDDPAKFVLVAQVVEHFLDGDLFALVADLGVVGDACCIVDLEVDLFVQLSIDILHKVFRADLFEVEFGNHLFELLTCRLGRLGFLSVGLQSQKNNPNE